MDIRKLRHAVTLARFLNYTRAAHELGLTQSALSRSILTLETECGLQLFDRNRGMVALTQAGREFIRHAERLLGKEAALRSLVGHEAHGGGQVTLGVTPLVARFLLAPVLSLRVGDPHFHAEVVIGSSKQILPRIMQGTIDLGICVGDLSISNSVFSAVPLGELSFSIIVRKDHPLTRADSVDVEDLELYPLIRSTPSTADDVLPIILGLMPRHPPKVLVEEYDVLSEIAATSDAVWVTSPLAVAKELLDGKLVSIPISWLSEPKISLVAYSLSDRTLSPVAGLILKDFQAASAALSLDEREVEGRSFSRAAPAS